MRFLFIIYSIFCKSFCNCLINYIIKMIYFLRNISKWKKRRRLYLILRFGILTLFSYLTYFDQKIEFFIFNSVFLNKNIRYIIHPVEQCSNENLKTLFRRMIFYLNVFFVSHIFCLKN